MDYYFKVLENYTTFTGRARRSEYWYFFLFNIIFAVTVGYIGWGMGIPVLSDIYTIAVFIPGVAVAVRRMHDVGKSGWFAIIPFYNLILACTEGVEGDNEYGADPKSDS